MNMIKLANQPIGRSHPPMVVAEMSGNHHQSLERALAIVSAAAKAGAHALKLQTYTADTMTLDLDRGPFHIDDAESLWKGRSLHSLYREAYTPWEWHAPIFQRCRELGILAFSTPFDETAVDFLESLQVPCYKIASFENNHIPLIRKVAATRKPLIISTGMATMAETDEAVSEARRAGASQIVLLKCTSSYPSPPDATNLLTIPHLRDAFDVEVGLSDHTIGTGVAAAAVALGAVIVEKHFTLSRADGGVDAAFSAEPLELQALVEETTRAWQALGRISYGPSEAEKASLRLRRSLYVVQDLQAGAVLTNENVRPIRPAGGLPPSLVDQIVGRKIRRAVCKGTPLTWDLI
ncbi:MAG: pseudaminic acid synthase [Pseudomonadota bacterium]